MILRLKEEHLMWVVDGSGFSDKVINLIRDVYVNGMTRKDATKRSGYTHQMSAKKFILFEALINKRCDEEGITISTILVDAENLKAVEKLDSIVKRYKNKV